MSQDNYQWCPCGRGKKIKFCCGKPVMADVEQVQRALRGDQRMAALDHLERTLKKHPKVPALLALKTQVLLQLKEFDRLREAAAELNEAAPGSQLALTLTSLLAAHDGDLKAVTLLHEAIVLTEPTIHSLTYQTMAIVARLLIGKGLYCSARMHLMIHAGITEQPDQTSAEAVFGIQQAPEIPAVMKQDRLYRPPPEDAPWSASVVKVLATARQMNWLATRDTFEILNRHHPDQPDLIFNHAILLEWLGDVQAAAEAYRKFSQLPGVELADAVEAEAIAQHYEPHFVPVEDRDTLDLLFVEYPVADVERVQELLVSDPQCRPAERSAQAERYMESEQTTPKMAADLYDRPIPASADDLQFEDLPQLLCHLFLHGRETDRDARLVMVVADTPGRTAAHDWLTTTFGDQIKPPLEPKVAGKVSALEPIFSWKWGTPPGLTPERYIEFDNRQRRHALLEQWAHLPQRRFGGKSPREVADDPQFKIPLLAAILSLEMDTDPSFWKVEFYNELRSSLGLPVQETIRQWDPENDSRLWELAYVDPQELSEEQLLGGFSQAQRYSCVRALKAFGQNIVDRGLAAKAPGVYRLLARSAETTEKMLNYMRLAREQATAEGESPAPFYLEELSAHLSMGNVDEAQRVLNILQSRHMREPGVAEATYQLLATHGALPPNAVGPGQAAAGPPLPAGAPPDAGPTSGGSESGLWTPDGDATAGEGEKKSKLWLPGSD